MTALLVGAYIPHERTMEDTCLCNVLTKTDANQQQTSQQYFVCKQSFADHVHMTFYMKVTIQ